MIKKYLILVVVGAFIYSLVIGILGGTPFSLTDPKMIGAIIFLFCFPFPYVYKDYKAIEDAKEQYPNKNISLAYSEELIINNPKSDCIGIILSVLEKLNAESVKQIEEATLACKVVPSKTEFGGIRKVKIQLFEVTPNQTKITIESRPTLFIQFIDYGVNFKTVQLIIESIKETSLTV